MISSRDFSLAIQNAGFVGGVGVPCSYFAAGYNAFTHMKNFSFYVSANEGEALSIASGAWLAGKKLFVFCQNSGLGNMVDPLTSLNHPFQIPVLLLITWRGQPGTKDEPHHKFMGAHTQKLLDVLGVQHEQIATSQYELKEQLQRLVKKMQTEQLPVALVIPEGALINDFETPGSNLVKNAAGELMDLRSGNGLLTRIEALESVLAELPSSTAFITTTGKTGREFYTLRDQQQHFYMGGAMGCASALSLGVAEHTDCTVAVLDGDGAALMRLENLTTIGARRPKNLIHILLDNNVHDSTGGQLTSASNTDFPSVAKACGYRAIICCDDEKSLKQGLYMAQNLTGPTFLYIKIKPGSMTSLGRPEIALEAMSRRFQNFLEYHSVDSISTKLAS